MEDNLFRTKALNAKSDMRLGSATIVQPISIWVLALLGFVAILVAVLFLIYGEYTRKTKVFGRLYPIAGSSGVYSTVSGNVSRIFIRDGASVRVGDPLVLVSVEHKLASGENATSVHSLNLTSKKRALMNEVVSRTELMDRQAASTIKQLAFMKKDLVAASQELEIRKKQAVLSEVALRKFRSLLEQKYVSELQAAQAEHTMLEQQANVKVMERSIGSISRNIAQSEQALAELGPSLNLLKSQVRREIITLDQELLLAKANSDALIVSTLDGTVSNQLVTKGQAVQTGQPLLTVIAKNSKLKAYLYVPSSAIGLVNVGDSVLLKYRAFPYQKFGHQSGRVEEVPKVPLSARELSSILGEFKIEESVYRVTVALDSQALTSMGKNFELKAGMDIDAEVVGETRPLWRWLFKL